MLARLQQLTTVALAGAVVGWATWFLAHGRPGLAIAGVAAVGLSYAAILGIEFVLLYQSYDAGDLLRPRARQLIGAWMAEVLCAPCVFLWRQPFRSGAELDSLATTTPARRGVVFVHGFICNRGLWNPWMARFRRLGLPFLAVDLEPVFGSIDQYVATVDSAVATLERATGLAPVIVSHSMGGLAVRAWLAGNPGRESRAHQIVTIGAPHAGTWLACLGRTMNGRQMRLGSAWLQALKARETLAGRERFTCFFGHCDNIVFPTSSATLAGADNRHLPGTPHVKMAYHPAIVVEVLRLLDVDSPDGPASATGSG
ncbi:MAG: alpha/beta fold hydrolase [Caldimonas sp.]